ncbi:hypothetical protein F9C07_7858 [Aspergillus flavus]|uniref:C6 finger transcription factor imqK n=2 Tax=Aspergillus flavus (strain ATCC 200026 / FGSC A1120 / IAM 13836 / NRRL 3357 / JCM 12722 / SRRC 167) TaxID=332952 RepID=IMQK_ASPFN|nr:RecName: Full=C6 finger transcription factor imqK; AltName: Full=Imizoquin biosynthesis cluster protein K [Aspergillus flavus NRRL3357]KAF7621813.1 hypothetical protein AFLA_008366 [Aspergillus flavus NRRL3357]QRD93401.1 hypothetical protein F9C07_7858 [Aspergillus flavus]
MEPDTTRRSACDRCRGQKLRCVRLPGPAREDSPRSARSVNQPCERCKRAKVVCYTTKPVSRRLPQSYTRRRSTAYADDVMHSEVDLDEGMIGSNRLRDEPTIKRTPPAIADRLAHDPFPTELWSGLDISHASLDSSAVLSHVPDPGNMVESVAAQRANSNTLPSHQHGWPEDPHGALNYFEERAHDLPDVMSVSSPTDVRLGLDTVDRRPAAATSRTNQAIHSDTVNMHSQAPGSGETSERGLYSRASNTVADAAQLCTTQLSELNMRLMKDIESTTSFRQGMSAASDPNYPASGLGETSPSSSMVKFTNTMLANCQSFLDILQRLRSPTVELRGSSNSECSYGDLEYSSNEYSSSRSQSRNHSTSASSRSKDGRISAGGGLQSVLNSDTIGLSPSLDPIKADSSALDFSAFLSILSCYTHILRAYDALFTEILEMLMESSCIQLDLKIHNLVPEVSLGGFRLSGHGDLQIKCLLHMSFIILEKIESMLGVNAPEKDPYGSNGGLLNNSQLRGLLEALYHQKEFDYIRADGTRAARVKKTMKSIQRILDSI